MRLPLPVIVLCDLPQFDIADRYAPTAEAFAAGNWRFAFPPRVTPPLTAPGGVIVLILRRDSHVACQLTAPHLCLWNRLYQWRQ